MNWSIDFAPLIPMPLFWGLIVLAAVLIGLLFLRRTRGASLRSLAVIAMLLALANPTLREEERDYLPTSPSLSSTKAPAKPLQDVQSKPPPSAPNSKLVSAGSIISTSNG